MERFFKKKLITAIMFILFLFVFAIANFINTYKAVKKTTVMMKKRLKRLMIR